MSRHPGIILPTFRYSRRISSHCISTPVGCQGTGRQRVQNPLASPTRTAWQPPSSIFPCLPPTASLSPTMGRAESLTGTHRPGSKQIQQVTTCQLTSPSCGISRLRMCSFSQDELRNLLPIPLLRSQICYQNSLLWLTMHKRATP